MHELYHVLGVRSKAADEEIKVAFRRLADYPAFTLDADAGGDFGIFVPTNTDDRRYLAWRTRGSENRFVGEAVVSRQRNDHRVRRLSITAQRHSARDSLPAAGTAPTYHSNEAAHCGQSGGRMPNRSRPATQSAGRDRIPAATGSPLALSIISIA